MHFGSVSREGCTPRPRSDKSLASPTLRSPPLAARGDGNLDTTATCTALPHDSPVCGRTHSHTVMYLLELLDGGAPKGPDSPKPGQPTQTPATSLQQYHKCTAPSRTCCRGERMQTLRHFRAHTRMLITRQIHRLYSNDAHEALDHDQAPCAGEWHAPDLAILQVTSACSTGSFPVIAHFPFDTCPISFGHLGGPLDLCPATPARHIRIQSFPCLHGAVIVAGGSARGLAVPLPPTRPPQEASCCKSVSIWPTYRMQTSPNNGPRAPPITDESAKSVLGR